MSDLERLARRAVGGDVQAALNLFLLVARSAGRNTKVWPVMQHGPDEEENVSGMALSELAARAECAKLALAEADKDGKTVLAKQIRQLIKAEDYQSATEIWNEFCESEYRDKYQVLFFIGEPVPVIA